MIKAEELRIGDTIQNIHGVVIKVDCIKKLRAKDGNFYLINGLLEEHLSGVPLTEEILLKCGFIKGECYFSFNDFDIDLEGWFGFDNMVANASIKYLHQLQNLYFALTGEELDISNLFTDI